MAHRFVDAGDVELTNGTFRRIRAALGLQAFGINQVDLPPNQSGFEHDEKESNQDEVYVIIAGGGRMTVGDGEIALAPGRFVYVSPEETRCLHSGPDGLSCIIVGAAHETPNHPKGFF